MVTVRKAIESTYSGICTIVENRDVTDSETKITSFEDVILVENQPCKLSFEKISPVVGNDTAANITQAVKLFLAPEVMVNGGSKIIVTQNGVTNEYTASSQPAVYSTHQEIVLNLWKEYA